MRHMEGRNRATTEDTTGEQKQHREEQVQEHCGKCRSWARLLSRLLTNLFLPHLLACKTKTKWLKNQQNSQYSQTDHDFEKHSDFGLFPLAWVQSTARTNHPSDSYDFIIFWCLSARPAENIHWRHTSCHVWTAWVRTLLLPQITSAMSSLKLQSLSV